MTANPAQLGPAVPILFVRDVTAAARFWRDRAGFTIEFLHGTPPFYGAVSRDAARLHLRHVGQPNFADLAAREPALILATIEVSDVDALYADLNARGADLIQPPTDQPWGGRDLQLRDPDGNRLSFVTYRSG